MRLDLVHRHLNAHGYSHKNHINYDDRAGCYMHALYSSEDGIKQITLPIMHEEIHDEYVHLMCMWFNIPSPFINAKS